MYQSFSIFVLYKSIHFFKEVAVQQFLFYMKNIWQFFLKGCKRCYRLDHAGSTTHIWLCGKDIRMTCSIKSLHTIGNGLIFPRMETLPEIVQNESKLYSTQECVLHLVPITGQLLSDEIVTCLFDVYWYWYWYKKWDYLLLFRFGSVWKGRRGFPFCNHACKFTLRLNVCPLF